MWKLKCKIIFLWMKLFGHWNLTTCIYNIDYKASGIELATPSPITQTFSISPLYLYLHCFQDSKIFYLIYYISPELILNHEILQWKEKKCLTSKAISGNKSKAFALFLSFSPRDAGIQRWYRNQNYSKLSFFIFK